MNAALKEKIIALIGALPKRAEIDAEPDADQRTAAYWWGRPDDSVAWWLATCRMIAPHPVAQSMYLAHVVEDMSQRRAIKDWAYEAAAKFASGKGNGPRRRAVVESYRTDWGHQAARDGVAIALWDEIIDVPGISGQAERFHCGRQAYSRVRDELERETRDLWSGFRADMVMCESGNFSRDFIDRWERATGANWAALNWTAK